MTAFNSPKRCSLLNNNFVFHSPSPGDKGLTQEKTLANLKRKLKRSSQGNFCSNIFADHQRNEPFEVLGKNLGKGRPALKPDLLKDQKSLMHGKKTQKIGLTRTNSRLKSIKEHLLSPKNNKRILQNLKKSLMTQEDIRNDQKIDFIGRKKSPNKKIIYSKMNRSQFDSLLTKNLSTSQINTTQFNSHLHSPKISFNAKNSSALNSPNASFNFSQPKFRQTPTPTPIPNPHPQPNPNMNLKNLLSKKIQNQYNYLKTQPKILLEPKKELKNNNFLSKIKKIYSKEFCQENFKKILDFENFNSIIVDQRNNFGKVQQHID